MPGTRFFLGEGGDQRLRLTWAAAGPAEIDDAVERLRLALSDLVPSVTGT
jgi:hypothetical protein